MSQIIKIKHSTTTGNKPTSLSAGELALNVSDGNFFFGDGSNVQNYLHVGATTASTLAVTRTFITSGQTILAAQGGNTATKGKLLVTGDLELRSNIVMEGATANVNETTLTLVDPTADNTITFPDASGTVSLQDIPAHGLHYLPLSGGTVTGALNVSGNTEVKGVLRTRGGLQLGPDDGIGDNSRINFGIPGNKNHPQFKHTEVNQLILDRGGDTGTLVEFNTAQHSDGPAVKITGDIDLGDGYKLYLDGGTDTYLTTGGLNNIIHFYANNVNVVKFQEPGTLIATPLNVSGATDIDGTLNVNANLITNVTNPTSAQDAATKAYVDSFTPSGLHYLPLSGGTVTGALNVSGDTALGGDISLIDGKKLKLGHSGDLEIYHNGSNSIIEDTGTGTLFYRSGTQTFQNAAATKTMATFNAANSVDLRYNNNLKFETTNTGVKSTGNLVADGGDVIIDSTQKVFLDGGTDTYLSDGGVNNSIQLVGGDQVNATVGFSHTEIPNAFNVSGATNLAGSINVNGNFIKNVRNPSAALDAANKAYVDLYATSGVSSVAITGTDGIDVDSGSPITSSGTITLGLSNIPNTALANSSVNYGGVSLSLGGSDTTPAFNLSDATAYPGDSSLVTTGTITSGVWNNDRLFSLQTAEGAWMGDYVTFGEEVATTAGSLYYYNGTTWAAADASAVNTSTGMLGIALGDSNAAGLLIRGMYGLLSYDPGSSGEVLYVSEVAGKVTNTAPTTASAVVRVVGYAMSDTPQLWFNPDNTWVELS